MTPLQEERYKRHLMLPEIGQDGQQKLLDSNVLIIGAGGLGSPVALYLAAAGVGHIGIVDFDRVDLSNLQRQIIHTTQNIGILKTDSAQKRIESLNPDVKVTAINQRFSEENAKEIIESYDIVIDATDNLNVKFLINDICVKEKKPFVHGAINQFTGNVLTVVPGSACIRCVFPDAIQMQPSSSYGVFGVIPGITGCIQAAEAIKFITGIGNLLTNKLLTFNALTMQFETVAISKSPFCHCAHL